MFSASDAHSVFSHSASRTLMMKMVKIISDIKAQWTYSNNGHQYKFKVFSFVIWLNFSLKFLEQLHSNQIFLSHSFYPTLSSTQSLLVLSDHKVHMFRRRKISSLFFYSTVSQLLCCLTRDDAERSECFQLLLFINLPSIPLYCLQFSPFWFQRRMLGLHGGRV